MLSENWNSGEINCGFCMWEEERGGAGPGKCSFLAHDWFKQHRCKFAPRLLSVSVVANNLHVCLFSSREARNIFLLVIACHSTKFDPFSCPSMKIIA